MFKIVIMNKWISVKPIYSDFYFQWALTKLQDARDSLPKY